jgi:diaminopimelate epimerase
MKMEFFKYQGTGNDFVMIDNRGGIVPSVDTSLVQRICDRKNGIGADGLILLQEHPTLDFEMIYWNADGSQSFCGNGSRCAVAFAKRIGLIQKDNTTFQSTDGEHSANILPNGWVSLHMHNVATVEEGSHYFYLNTGSPHYIRFVDDVSTVSVVEEGKAIRFNDRFTAEGTNVNFVEITDDGLKVRTYERGVEDETLSCGTGVTAAAITASVKGLVPQNVCKIETLGGNLQVRLQATTDQRFEDIWLEGPATFVFKGEIEL